MCIFTGSVSEVSATRIFARAHEGSQYIVYEMSLDTADDVAMVLPIPVENPGVDEVVEFIDLSGYHAFFDDMESLFPEFRSLYSDSWGSDELSVSLKVHHVGAYDASYIPSIGDFSRLDDRFRLSPEVWAAFPQYADYGFVVFQLRPGRSKFHPMAFSFPTRESSALYFPTTHVHDMAVRESAIFDHALYSQTDGARVSEWFTAAPSPEQDSDAWTRMIERSEGIVSSETPLHCRFLSGILRNEDTWMPI